MAHTRAFDDALNRLLTDRWLRVFLEAYLLARTAYAEIVVRLELPVKLIEQYHDECYAVTPQLSHPSRVVSDFIKPHEAVTEDEIVERVVKTLAYSGGTLVVDQVRQTLAPMLPGPFAQQLGLITKKNDLADLRMRRIFATELAAYDPYGPRAMAYLYSRLPRREQAAERKETTSRRPAVASAPYPPPPRRVGRSRDVA